MESSCEHSVKIDPSKNSKNRVLPIWVYACHSCSNYPLWRDFTLFSWKCSASLKWFRCANVRTKALRLQTTKFTPLQIRRPIFTPAAQRHPPGVAGPRSCHFCFSFGRSAKRFLRTSPTEIIQYVNSQHRGLFSFTPWPNWRLPTFRLGRPVQLYNGGFVAIPEPQQHFQRCSEALMQPWRHAWRENYSSDHDIQT